MNIHIFTAVKPLYEAAGQLFATLLQQKPGAVLGLATGGTPVGIYNNLAERYRLGQISFARATSFNLDEYIGLPTDHQEAYRTYMNENLFNHIDLPAERAFIPDGNAADIARECDRYDSLIASAGRIDIQLLGLGHNGHIGFNEPDETLSSRTHIATLLPETREANARFFNTIEEVPSYAITMGVGHIMQARMALLVVTGGDKARIVAQSLNGPITTKCPASLLQLHPNLVVMLDQEAAGQLKESYQFNESYQVKEFSLCPN